LTETLSLLTFLNKKAYFLDKKTIFVPVFLMIHTYNQTKNAIIKDVLKHTYFIEKVSSQEKSELTK